MQLGEKCKQCKLVCTQSVYPEGQTGVDPCLGILPGVKYACCGHGKEKGNIVWAGVDSTSIVFVPVSIATKRGDDLRHAKYHYGKWGAPSKAINELLREIIKVLRGRK